MAPAGPRLKESGCVSWLFHQQKSQENSHASATTIEKESSTFRCRVCRGGIRPLQLPSVSEKKRWNSLPYSIYTKGHEPLWNSDFLGAQAVSALPFLSRDRHCRDDSRLPQHPWQKKTLAYIFCSYKTRSQAHDRLWNQYFREKARSPSYSEK